MNIFKIIRVGILSLLVMASFPAFVYGKSEKVLTVYTSILPQRYFVEKIGGERVDVKVLVSPGKSPATYEPTPQQVMGLGRANCLFTIGVPFEKSFLPAVKSILPVLKVIDTTAGIKRRTMRTAHHHHGDDEHHHDEGMKDPHVWMAPQLVKIQAKNIYDALIEIDPQGKYAYRKGFDALIAELDKIDAELKARLAPFKGQTVLIFHPSLGYFTDAYGLKQEAIETGGKNPSPSTLEKIIQHAREDRAKIIFVQPEFSQNSAQSIAEAIDGSVVPVTPLNPDYINNLSQIASELEKAFK